MIGNISGASTMLSQLLSSGASSNVVGGASVASNASATNGVSTKQDLQSFMTALIQELRAGGGLASSGVAAATSSGAQPTNHNGAHHMSAQLEAMLQQLSGTSNAGGASAVAAIANSSAQNSATNSLQSSFQRLVQDLRSSPGAGSMVRATA
jgi:hypothetical protein